MKKFDKNERNIKRCQFHREPAPFELSLTRETLESEGLAYLVYVVELFPGEELYGDVLVALVA